MTVLILADEFDPSADRMVMALQDRQVPVCRIDTSWFPSKLAVEAQLRDGRWSGLLRTPARCVKLEEIRSVWYRSPTAYRFPDALSGPERHHAFMEAKFGLGGVLSSLPVLWVNHPARVAAVYKPIQLATAARCGLRTPDTVITNEPEAVRRFVEREKTVTKMLGANHIAEDGSRKITFTRMVDKAELTDLRGIRTTLHQFQRWVPKSHEARIIAVGEQLFGFAINAGSAAAHIDFRADYEHLDYEPFDIPSDMADGIRRFLTALGLTYGAFDFVVGPDGAHFLECNASGQYGWLEAATGVPLTEAIADLLASGVTP